MLPLLVSKSTWNQSSLSNRFPSLHPTRAAWIADASLKAQAASELLFGDPSASVGSLQSDLSMVVSSLNMALLFDVLDLAKYAPWAESSRQKSEFVEQLLGLVIILSASENPPYPIPDTVVVTELTLQVTQALVLLAKHVDGVPKDLVTSLIQSFTLCIIS